MYYILLHVVVITQIFIELQHCKVSLYDCVLQGFSESCTSHVRSYAVLRRYNNRSNHLVLQPRIDIVSSICKICKSDIVDVLL
jgi:hypothetical protein